MIDRADRLPDKLSDLLELAVADAIAASRLPGVRLDMNTWHEETPSGLCLCMAGAVMHQTLGVRGSNKAPHNAARTARERIRLMAINEMRWGMFGYHVEQLGGRRLLLQKRRRIWLARSMQFIRWAFQDDLGRARWGAYRHAVKLLRKAGL